MSLVLAAFSSYMALLNRIERTLRPLDLTIARYEIPMAVAPVGALQVNTIGAQLQVHVSSVSSAVNRLESSRLAQRHRHKSDGRIVMVKAT